MSCVWVNGKVFSKQTQFSHDVAYEAMCGNKEKAADMVIREVRKRRRTRQSVTFGFMEAKPGSRRYFFTRDLKAYDDDFQGKLRIYKEWKRFCKSRNCDLATYEVTSVQIIPGQKSETKTVESHDIVDLSRPVKIKFYYTDEITI